MKTKKIIFVLFAVCMSLLLTGCLETSREEAAQLRWQNALDQARIDAARDSIQQGQLNYAQKVLEDVKADSIYAETAKQMLANLQTPSIEVAHANAQSQAF